MMERAAVREAQREIKTLKRMARKIWTEQRIGLGHWSYTDLAALRSLEHGVERAYPNIDERDLVSALTEHAKDPRTRSPWYADEWIAQARRDREAKFAATLPVEEQLARQRAARR